MDKGCENKMMLYPPVKQITLLDPSKDGVLDVGSCQTTDYTILFDERLEALTDLIVDLYPSDKRNGLITFKFQKMKEEAYQLIIKKRRITIKASTANGCYYALVTLKQLAKQYQGFIPSLVIKDEPDLKFRCFMLDISRNKVPKKETIYQYIDLLSDLKYNQLQLYVEGFSFEYKSMPFVNQDNNYISVEEYQQIEKYANQHFIDLIPNQNGFGHMTEWLKLDQFKHLANTDGLFKIWGSYRTSSTLDPTNEESIKLVKAMYRDMLPYSNSPYFNMNFDEPYELGFNKSKPLCDEIGKEAVYARFFNTLAKEVKTYNKQPMLWGDVVIHHPEAIKSLDEDAILIDWGYSDDYPFLRNAKMLKQLKRLFMMAPGSAGWAMASGKLLEMLGSVKNSAEGCIYYGGLGLVYTDWGDFGHLQYPVYAVPGLIYTSLLCWNYEKASLHYIKEILIDVLGSNELAQLTIDLQLYNQQESVYRSYSSKLFYPLIHAEQIITESNPIESFKKRMDSVNLSPKEVDYYKLYFNWILKRCEKLPPSTIKDELINTVLLLEAMIKVHEFYYLFSQKKSVTKILEEIKSSFAEYKKEHQRLWNLRNKEDGYYASVDRIIQLENVLSNLKKEAINYE